MGDISPNFNRSEFACNCGCGFDTVDTELIDVLETVRAYFNNRRMKINSGCRCKAHNKSVGGSKRSQHRTGKAADIEVMNVPANAVAKFINRIHPDKYGMGRYNTFTHIDVRSGKARWDKR